MDHESSLDNTPDDEEMKEDLVDQLTNGSLEVKFGSKLLEEYWCSALNMIPRLSKKAIKVIISFGTTYLRESRFRTLPSIKTRSRNRLKLQADMQIALSNNAPCFKKLITEHYKQSH